jgi:hypothetical protein
MINLCGAIFERKGDVIQEVVGGATEIPGKRSSYSSFALILTMILNYGTNYGTSESA